MKLFIQDNEKITTYYLPEEVSEMFLFSYIGKMNKQENHISVESSNNNWFLKSNGSVDVLDDSNIVLPSLILENYKRYKLRVISEEEPVYLYSLPSKDANSKEISLLDISNIIKIKEIKIGNNNKCEIYYNNSLLEKKDIKIIFENDFWYIVASENSEVYLNKTRIYKCKLSLGDVIFIYGLSIIWMGSFFRINNPFNSVIINGLNNYISPDYGVNTNFVEYKANSNDFINEREYFFHTPTLRPVLEKENVKIDAPPQSPLQEDLPFLLSLGSSLTMASSSFITGFSVYNSLTAGEKTLYQCLPQIIMFFSMIVGSLFMPRIISLYQKHKRKQKERKRQRKYKEYLEKKEEKIKAIMERQSVILTENNPSIIDCNKIISTDNRRDIWSREITDKDFLNVRLGLGETEALIDISAPEEHFTLDEDNLMEEVYKIVNKSRMLNNVPVVVNLVEKRIAAIIMSCNFSNAYLNAILLQLITHQSGADLKIVVFTDEDGNRKWNYLRSLSHCWSDDKTIRFFATNTEEYNEVDIYLSNEFKKRKEALKSSKSDENEDFDNSMGYKNFSPYYLIINDNYKKTKNLSIIQSVINVNENNGFSMLICDKTLLNVPKKIQSFIQITDIDGCISDREVQSTTQHKFIPEYSYDIDMNFLAEKISNIPIMGKDAASTLPTMLSFLEMYNVSKIEQLNIQNRWKENNPTINLATPVGVHTNGDIFKLDLHEKYHGPHGLIAGSTGSGKSEFIITFLLSMAINYHPYEVQFVLIDYKGGGLAGAFENKESGVKIPHLAGTITNLDKSEINRTLVSIQSELKRRQRIFNEVKDSLGESTMDIYKYQRYFREGAIEEPVSHLFIVSDEFAELKSQQPEFMDELISTARIGRSLGVHLILATQKPSGVVNDQIWSNAKFKVCLKVQDRSDSMEMLKKPDAASIKETGRFYLQVGYDDYFDVGQSAWAGAKYIPSDTVKKKIDDSIVFINNIGAILKSINNTVKTEKNIEEKGDQLTNIVKYLYDIGVKQNIKTKQMWLENIPSEIFLNALEKKYGYKTNPYQINPVIGEYDNPEGQSQGLLTLDLTNVGNVLIYGMGGVGKANLLITLITSICLRHKPEEVNLYIFDYGAETLKIFSKFPHVGSVVTVDSEELLFDTLIFVEKEIEYRKDLFVDYGGTYTNYNNESGKKLPLIIVIINNYEVFVETNSRLSDQLMVLIRDGAKIGIVFIITTASNNAVRNNSLQLFMYKLSLQQSDPSNYRLLLNSKKGLEPKKTFGRGIIANDDGGYEFQTAFICNRKKINATIRQLITTLNQAFPEGVKKIKSMPNIITFDTLKDEITNLTKVPIGYTQIGKDVFYYDFYSKVNTLIISKKLSITSYFVQSFPQVLSKVVNKLIVIDAKNMLEDISINNMIVINNNYEDNLNKIAAELFRQDNQLRVLLIVGLASLINSLSKESYEKLKLILAKLFENKYSRSIIIDDISEIEKIIIEPWVSRVFDFNNGIWLGPECNLQTVIKFKNVSSDIKKANFAYMGVACLNNQPILIKTIAVEEE